MHFWWVELLLLQPTNMKESSNNLRMIEFFSGIGGMRLAVEEALLSLDTSNSKDHLSFCQAYDISLYANRTYKHNFINDQVSTKLVEQLKVQDLDGKADLWTMSPPCQPFTMTRGAKGLDMDDKRCHGLKGIMTLLTSINQKPQWILLENVKGFATSRMCQAWKECLQANGYGWKEYLLSPIQLGIPNHRLRYYILCEHESTRWSIEDDNGNSDTRIFQEPPFDSDATAARRRIIGEYVDKSLSLQELEPYMVSDSILSNEWAKQLGVVAAGDMATHCFTAGYGRIFSKATGSLLLFRGHHLTPNEFDQSTNLNDNIGAKEIAVADRPINRSDMSLYSGQLRRFTPKELLTLFGFPKSFSFPSDISMDHHYKLVGNSINVTVVAMLLKELLLRRESSTKAETSYAHLTEQPKRNVRDESEPGTKLYSHPQSPQNPFCISSDDRIMTIGGINGHIEESIGGNLLRLYEAYRWKPLPNCTGRYTCRDHKLVSSRPPLEILAQAGIYFLESSSSTTQNLPLTIRSFQLPGRADTVLVVPLDTLSLTGMITFEKRQADGTTSYVHTWNAPSGFRRKLTAIGIANLA